MGFKSMFKSVKNAVTFTKIEDATPPSRDSPPTRWEKAVIGMNAMVSEVSKFDPDGVDVVCFPGSGGEGGYEHDIYRNIKDISGLEALVTAREPQGPCKMGQAMDVVLKEAFSKDSSCSILVLTAGRPDDHEQLSKSLEDAAKKVNKNKDITVTFVQVGDDEWATKYLKYLDDRSTTNDAGEEVDIVDAIKDEDIKKAVKEMKEGKSSSGATGAIAGAFAGAAMGVGGMYLVNNINAKKRTKGWNGKWRALYDGEEIAVLKVKDDMDGCLEIKGWPDNCESFGNYAEDTQGGYNIQHSSPDYPEDIVIGTIEDEHTIAWDDGTRWEEVPPKGKSWLAYSGAAVAGAVVGGATGYLLEKKFFNKASKKAKNDYVIVLDRSQMMAVPDLGK